jgi:hypothetical protein
VRGLIDLDAGADAPALIGRHVRVLFTEADPGWLDRLVIWLFARLRARR